MRLLTILTATLATSAAAETLTIDNIRTDPDGILEIFVSVDIPEDTGPAFLECFALAEGVPSARAINIVPRGQHRTSLTMAGAPIETTSVECTLHMH